MNSGQGSTAVGRRRQLGPEVTRLHGRSKARAGRPARLGQLVGAGLAPLAALIVLRLLYGAAVHAWPSGGLSAASTVDEVVLGLFSWVAVALCAWLALGVTLTALTRLPGRVGRWIGVLADRVTPAVLRRSLTMLLGVSVSTVALPTGTASGAVTTVVAADSSGSSGGFTVTDAGPGLHATAPLAEPFRALVPHWSVTENPNPGFRATDRHDDRQGDQQQGPGWRPTAPVRTAGARSTLLTPAPRTASALVEHVTVRRGDSLWSIVARHLGPGASDTEIAHEWPRWFAANAAVIGEDPDLILPGQQLAPPLEGAHP
ncbi:MAG: hypothetical protein L0H96_22215 [Humibacillus sp.]|nr:hypothetical protein [Humibacillus sp.]MDN5779610.1 hypothetical protein [Humibacillus sp.]